MPGYRIVATGVNEFDYPKGDQNVYTSYQGKGGIPIDSYWKRLLFAWTQSDVNILLTSYLEPGSRIQIWRQVQERVSKIAPFLRLDNDPYAVLSEGKQYWIQDAYTVSDQYPYSTPQAADFGAELNYVRNSVKVVVDMYDGTVMFYVMDPDDPVLAVYRSAFPGVFRDLGQLSQDLKNHLRYPEDLFAIQADLYRSFHMTVPQVFYNQVGIAVSNATDVSKASASIVLTQPGVQAIAAAVITSRQIYQRTLMGVQKVMTCEQTKPGPEHATTEFPRFRQGEKLCHERHE